LCSDSASTCSSMMPFCALCAESPWDTRTYPTTATSSPQAHVPTMSRITSTSSDRSAPWLRSSCCGAVSSSCTRSFCQSAERMDDTSGCMPTWTCDGAYGASDASQAHDPHLEVSRAAAVEAGLGSPRSAIGARDRNGRFALGARVVEGCRNGPRGRYLYDSSSNTYQLICTRLFCCPQSSRGRWRAEVEVMTGSHQSLRTVCLES
jgi:hypothetical protein